MGALPLEEDPTNTSGLGRINKQLSLHINFGYPEGITLRSVMVHKTALRLISDVLSIAFSSPERLLDRKTLISFNMDKSGKKGEKNAKTPEIIAGEGNEETYRIELRSLEFSGYPSYRLITEAQRLMAAFFCVARGTAQRTALTAQEQRLANIIKNSLPDIMELLEPINSLPEGQHTTSPLDTPQESRPELIRRIKQHDLQKKCRHLVWKLSHEINIVLQGEQKSR